MKYLPEEEIARRAYEAWRAEVNEPRLPAWEAASDVTRNAWESRVALYHELPWTVMQDHGVMDRLVREACAKAGR